MGADTANAGVVCPGLASRHPGLGVEAVEPFDLDAPTNFTQYSRTSSKVSERSVVKLP